jgi:glutamate racemase
VAVFDSGLGGLSVLGAVREMFAGVRVDYLADGAFFPYGPRAEDEIRQRVVEVIRAYLRQPGAAGVVVIACNTASTAALGALRGAFPAVRFVGVVPAVKPAALASRSKVIGVLATPGTVRRPYHAALIAQHAADCLVLCHGAAGLAALAEQALCTGRADLDAVRAEIAPLFSNRAMDTVVLGCTHYPLLRDALETVAPWPVQWCDSGLAVARQVGRQWGAEASRTPGPWRCFSTRDLGSSERILFQRWGFSRFARLEPISGIASRDAAPDN